MTRVLLVTVGGSPEPILKAVELHRPDMVIFACSAPPCLAPSIQQVNGDGLPCLHFGPSDAKEWRPNLITQLKLQGLNPEYQILELPDPDDLPGIHSRIKSFCLSLEDRFSKLELIGDYSGGTKSMSAALAMVLVDQNASITLMAGKRTNLIRIERNDNSRSHSVATIKASRVIQEQLPELLESHFYDRAATTLADLRQGYGGSIGAVMLQASQQLESSLRALMLWDRFYWDEAVERAEQTPLATHTPELISWWKRVNAARDLLHNRTPPLEPTGYELVQDLLLNAERRGRRGWYDDAVARLYRALELLAQTYIQLEMGYDHQSFWDDAQIQRDCQQWNVRRGVNGLYWWLSQTEGGTGLGDAARREWRDLRKLLDARNESLLGHGLEPVSKSEWESLQLRVTKLVSKALQGAGLRQGAPAHQLPGVGLLQLPCARILLGVAQDPVP